MKFIKIVISDALSYQNVSKVISILWLSYWN